MTIHHSNVRCDDCGERHTPGNPAECIEVLQGRIAELCEDAEGAAAVAKVTATALDELRTAATQYSRCCDLWQDGLGGMHCRECSHKTFLMLGDVQRILGVDKACKTIELPKRKA